MVIKIFKLPSFKHSQEIITYKSTKSRQISQNFLQTIVYQLLTLHNLVLLTILKSHLLKQILWYMHIHFYSAAFWPLPIISLKQTAKTWHITQIHSEFSKHTCFMWNPYSIQCDVYLIPKPVKCTEIEALNFPLDVFLYRKEYMDIEKRN